MDASVREEDLAWLRDHAREMLALPGFVDADLLARPGLRRANGRRTVCVHSRLRDSRGPGNLPCRACPSNARSRPRTVRRARKSNPPAARNRVTTAFRIARCAQPQSGHRSRGGAAAIVSFSSRLNSHVFESHGKIGIVENIANPCDGPVRRALAGLARQCSTTLSTAIVDKGKIFRMSPAYRAFLDVVATNGRKSGHGKS